MLDELKSRAKDFLRRRAQAYRIVFDKNGIMSGIVLRDLAKFCRAAESTFHIDPRAEGVLQGRREVWLRIAQHIQLTDDELWELLNNKP